MRYRAKGGGGIRVRTNPNTTMPTEKLGQSSVGGRDDGASGEMGRVDKKIEVKGLFSPNKTSRLCPRPASSSSLQNSTVVVQEEGSRPFNGMSPFAEFIASFAYKGGGKVDDKTSTPPPPPLPPLQNKKKTTTSAAANQSQFARRVSRFFPHNPGDIVVDIKKNIAGNDSGEIGRVDSKSGQERGLLSPNNTSLCPRPASSSSLQSTTNSSVVVPDEASDPFNGMSPAEFFASFAYKGGGKVDERTSIPPPPPPPPPPLPPLQSKKKTTTTTSATANQTQFARRVSRFFPHNPGDIVVDIKKNIAGKHSGEIGKLDKKRGQGRGLLSPNYTCPLRPRPRSSSSLQNATNSIVVQEEEGSRLLFNGMSPAEFFASFAYKGGGEVDDRTSSRPPPPARPLQNRRKTATTTTASAAANHSEFARRVTRYFPHKPGDIVVDVKKNIAGKRRADSGGGTTRKRPRTTGQAGSTGANRQQQKPKGRRKQCSVQLSAKEKFSDAYRRVSDQTMWDAPRSSHNLLQERHCFDPWRVLVICILLNVTNGNKQVRKVLPGLFLLCPNAKAAVEGIRPQLVEKLRGLGLQHKRSDMILKLSQRYLKDDWTHVTQLPGVGKYAADAYAIFAAGKLDQVKPQDHKLVKYWEEVRKMTLAARN